MPALHQVVGKAFAAPGLKLGGDEKVLDPQDEDEAGYSGGADRFAGFEGRFDEFADSLDRMADEEVPEEKGGFVAEAGDGQFARGT